MYLLYIPLLCVYSMGILCADGHWSAVHCSQNNNRLPIIRKHTKSAEVEVYQQGWKPLIKIYWFNISFEKIPPNKMVLLIFGYISKFFSKKKYWQLHVMNFVTVHWNYPGKNKEI